jgi:hypothetical protein
VSTGEGRPLRTRPSSREALADQRRAERIQSELLPQVRQAAERWAAAIGALLAAVGVAGIASGPDRFRALEAPWGDVGAVALLLGVLCGVASLWLAASASIFKFDRILISGEELRRAEQRRFSEAHRQLTGAQRAAAVAMTALLAAVVIQWAAPTEAARRRLVLGRTAGGETICGVMSGQGSTALVEVGDGGALVRELVGVRVVPRCPRTR